MRPTILIGDCPIGTGHPCFIIAEAGVNHNGDVNLAKQLIEVAASAGANAVKFQTFKAETLVSPIAEMAEYQKNNFRKDLSQFEMIQQLELSFDAFRELKEFAQSRGALFLSTPFDVESANFLDEIGVPAFKVSSGDLTDFRLLDCLARKKKPVVLSTGMSDLHEVETAVEVLKAAGSEELAILHCVSNYPADAKDMNLRSIQTLSQVFKVPVGLSDHSLGQTVTLAAVALGACIIEKHFTVNKAMIGPDHKCSLEPHELQTLVQEIRQVEAALGDGRKVPRACERPISEVVRRSIVLAQDVDENECIAAPMLACLRPGTGIPPQFLSSVQGRRLVRSMKKGDVLHWEDII